MAGAAAYIVALQLVYVNIISVVFSYAGYSLHPVDLYLLVAGSLMALLPATWMPQSVEKPSQVALWIIYVVVLIPSVLVPLYALPSSVQWLGRGAILVALFGLLSRIISPPPGATPYAGSPPAFFSILVLSLTAVSHAMIFLSFSLSLDGLSLSDVYETRGDYKQNLEGLSIVIPYAVGWQTNVLNPLLFAWGLRTRNMLLSSTGLFGQLVVFSITGFKSALFSIFLLAAIFLAIRAPRQRMGVRIAWGIFVLVIGSVLVDRLFGSVILSSLAVRRLLVTPGLLTGYYLEFFSENPKAVLGHSILRAFLDSPYQAAPAHIIGGFYFGNPSTSANANFWADGYANFGLSGMAFATLILGAVLRLYDRLSHGVDLFVSSSIISVLAVALCNSALLTSIMTHGIAFSLGLVYLMPRRIDVASQRGGAAAPEPGRGDPVQLSGHPS